MNDAVDAGGGRAGITDVVVRDLAASLDGLAEATRRVDGVADAEANGVADRLRSAAEWCEAGIAELQSGRPVAALVLARVVLEQVAVDRALLCLDELRGDPDAAPLTPDAVIELNFVACESAPTERDGPRPAPILMTRHLLSGRALDRAPGPRSVDRSAADDLGIGRDIWDVFFRFDHVVSMLVEALLLPEAGRRVVLEEYAFTSACVHSSMPSLRAIRRSSDSGRRAATILLAASIVELQTADAWLRRRGDASATGALSTAIGAAEASLNDAWRAVLDWS